MYYSGDLAAAKQADVLRHARGQARVHEALLARGGLGEHGGLRFFARFVPAFGRSTKFAGGASEVLGQTRMASVTPSGVSGFADGWLESNRQAVPVNEFFFGRRTKVAGEAVEALGADCGRARRWVSLSLDGELAEAEQALLVGHLADCAACSSFQADLAASTAMLRGAPAALPERAFDLVRVTQEVNGMPAGSEGILVKGIVRSPFAYKADEVLVRFWDGGPLRVPGNALTRIGRLPAAAAA